MRGDMKNEEEISFLQSTVGHGLDREELRDEIYAQCMRQATGNPSADMCEKVIFCLHSFHCQKQKRYIWRDLNWTCQIWILLALCIVAFPPSKLLWKYFESFVRKNSQQPPSKCGSLIEWCGERLRTPRVADRKMVSFPSISSWKTSCILTYWMNEAPFSSGNCGRATIGLRRLSDLFHRRT